ncbi:MAG: hypothetical protein FWG79_03675 [Bacteroidales bacterium]|nr:hypothetical protein [Bacteroidales bacterium]
MKKLIYFVAILAVVGTSCVKKEFDLNKDLDLTIGIKSSISIPLAKTDTLLLGDFLSIEEIEMLDTINGRYVFNMDSIIEIDLESLNDVAGLGTDAISHSFDQELKFDGFGDFPTDLLEDLEFGLPKDTIDSKFYLPPAAVTIIQNFITDHSSTYPDGLTLSEINTLAEEDQELKDLLIAGGYDHFFPLPTDTTFDTQFLIDINEPLDNSLVLGIDEISLEENSGFWINVKALNLPTGMIINLEKFELLFPTKVELRQGEPGVQTKYVFDTTGIGIENLEMLSLFVPVARFTGIAVEEGGDIILNDDIGVLVEYSMGGTYNAGPFHATSPETTTRLEVEISSKFYFKSATIELDVDEITRDLSFRDSIKFEESFELPDEITIVSIGNASLQGSPKIRVDMEFLSAANLTESIINELEIELTIDFPNFINFSPAIPNNKYVHHVVFNGGVAQPIILSVQSLNLSHLFTGGNEIQIDEEIKVSAEVSLRTSMFTVPDPIFDIDDLMLNVVAKIDSIVIEKITANISYELDLGDDIPTLDLSGILDIEGISIDSDSTVLDVSPQLELVLRTNLEAPLRAELELVPFKNGGPIAQNTVDIVLDMIPPISGGFAEHKFFIAKAGTPVPPGFTLITENLANIIRTIPDSIQIHVNGGINSANPTTLDFTTTYEADLSYRFVAPLAVGPDFRIVIHDTMRNIGDSLVGKLLNGNKIALVAIVNNDFPVDIIANVIPLDENDNRIPDLNIKPFEIKGNTSNYRSVLEFDDTETKDRGIINMRGLIWQLILKTSAGMVDEPLRPDNFIQIKLQAESKAGMDIDLREL